MSHPRNPGKGRSLGVNLGLIITPMLDMSFQILAFFIMTYHPAALEAHIPGSLVPGERADRNPNKPTDPVVDDPVSTLEDPLFWTPWYKFASNRRQSTFAGTPQQIFLQMPLDTEPQLVADVDGDFAAALKRLESQLKDMLNKKTVGRANVKIVGDGELRQQYVMMVYDVCKKAGFEKIHFVPPSLLNAKIGYA